jgi:hypothetical protein
VTTYGAGKDDGTGYDPPVRGCPERLVLKPPAPPPEPPTEDGGEPPPPPPPPPTTRYSTPSGLKSPPAVIFKVPDEVKICAL